MQTLDRLATEDLKIPIRANELFAEHRQRVFTVTDRMFAVLMAIQWVAGILAALIVSPRTWAGSIPQVHIHVWSALVCGGLLSSLPIYLALRYPGESVTRHVIAVAQMLWSALLIHLTGGRIETHFHVFGSLAFLAFYRDWRVLIPATIVIAVDHSVRGILWPQSVYGILTAAPFRSLEHAAWVVFEDVFLVYSCRNWVSEMKLMARQRAELEHTNELVAREVERKTADLRRSLNSEQAVFETAADGIITMGYDGVVLKFNSAAEHIFGYTANELIGQGIQKLMPSPHREAHDGYVRSFLESGVATVLGQRRELLGLHKDGTVFPLEINVTHVELEDGGFFTGFVSDITKRKRDEQALNESLEMVELTSSVNGTLSGTGSMRSLLQQCSQLILSALRADSFRIWTLNKEVGFLELQATAGTNPSLNNDHARVQVGKSLIGLVALEQKLYQCNDPLNDPRVDDKAWIERNGISGCAVYPLVIDGKAVGAMALYSKTQISQRVGDVLASTAHSLAIGIRRQLSETELAKANRQLVDASRQAGMAEVATGVLHNIGNVLTGVNTSAGCVSERLRHSKLVGLIRAATLIREHADDLGRFLTDDERGRHLPAYLLKLAELWATEQADLLKDLESLIGGVEHINNIVAMQQSYAKSFSIVDSVNLVELLEQVLALHTGTLEQRHIAVDREFEPVPELVTDKHKLLQILVNVVRNAGHALADAERNDRRLTLRLRENGEGQICIEVSDNGVGIAPENLTRVFAHGFTTKKDGHGFGLHSAALAAEEMGGSLTARSMGTGQGATFTLLLPGVFRTHVDTRDGDQRSVGKRAPSPPKGSTA